MAKHFNFYDQPRAEDFERIFYASDYASYDSEPSVKIGAIEKTIRKAVRFTKKNPDIGLACKLSFLESNKWLVPVRAGMNEIEIFKMDRLVKHGEIISSMAQIFGENREVNFYNKDFQKAAQEIGAKAPEAVQRFNNACKTNDFNAIHGGLLGLHIAALIQMEDLYKSNSNFVTVAYSKAKTYPGAEPTALRSKLKRTSQPAASSGPTTG